MLTGLLFVGPRHRQGHSLDEVRMTLLPSFFIQQHNPCVTRASQANSGRVTSPSLSAGSVCRLRKAVGWFGLRSWKLSGSSRRRLAARTRGSQGWRDARACSQLSERSSTRGGVFAGCLAEGVSSVQVPAYHVDISIGLCSLLTPTVRNSRAYWWMGQYEPGF